MDRMQYKAFVHAVFVGSTYISRYTWLAEEDDIGTVVLQLFENSVIQLSI